MTYPAPKALLRLPPSRNTTVRKGTAAVAGLLRKGKLQDAASQLHQLQQLEPTSADIALLQAELLILAGDHNKASQLLKQILSKYPGLVPALILSARAHTGAKRHLDALDALTLADELNSKDTNTKALLADTLSTLRRHKQAASCLCDAIGKSSNPADLARLAAVYDRAGDQTKSLEALDKIKRPPKQMADIHVLRAGTLLSRGLKKDALQSVYDALAANPHNASLRLFIAKNFSNEFPAEQLIRDIEEALKIEGQNSSTPEDLSRLHFALGLMLEKTGDHDKAFTAITKANDLIAPKNRQADLQMEKVAIGILDHFTKATLAGLAPAGNTSEQPVFITGLPRSGTTLVEQIISSHPNAAGLGELELIPHLKQSLVSLRSADISRTAEAYLAAVPEEHTSKARITDKSISTLLHTGLATLMFPKARLIFVRRHPMDIFWSAYREMFGTGAVTFSYKPDTLARRIAFSEHLILQWSQRLPEKILTVRYEDLVQNAENVSRALVYHTGLEWHDSCLEFYKSKSTVRTASMTQVRQKMHTGSINLWKHYEKQLSPVITLLNDTITAYENGC